MAVSVEQRRNAPRRMFQELVVEGRWEAMPEILAEPVVYHGPGGPQERGFDEYRSFLEVFHAALPDMYLDVPEVIVEDDLVAWRAAGLATHVGELMGAPGTGNRVRVGGIHMARVDDDGKIAESWGGPDNGPMLMDMGMLNPLTPPLGAESSSGSPRPDVVADVAPDAAKDLMRRTFVDAVNNRDDAATALVAADYVSHSLVGDFAGRESFAAALDGWLHAFPDLRLELVLMIAEGDRVAWRDRLTGTHGGDFFGYSASGQRVDFVTNHIGRVSPEGMVLEHWASVDGPTLFRQLGALST